MEKSGKASLEWMGTHSTVDAENKIRTSTDVEMVVFGGLRLSSPDTSVFAYRMLNVKSDGVK